MAEAAGQPMQRAGILAELPALLHSRGIAPVSIFDGTEIDPATLSADTRLPFRTGLSILSRAADVSGDHWLGLSLGLRFTMAHHGLIGRLMLSAQTLGQALLDFVSWQPGYSSGAVVYLLRWGDDYALAYATQEHSMVGHRHLYGCIAGVGVRMLEELTGGQVHPREVLFAFKDDGAAATYARLLRAQVRFNQSVTCLVIERQAMGRALTFADEAQHRAVSEEIRAVVQSTRPPVSARVRHIVRQRLLTGLPRMAEVSSDAGLHARTLRRRLTDEGTTFEEIRDATRFAVARELLEMTNLPVGDIAAATAFASHGVFSDAFRRWTGMPPSEWRKLERPV